MSQRVNCGQINQVTTKCQMDFGQYLKKSEYHHRVLHIRIDIQF